MPIKLLFQVGFLKVGIIDIIDILLVTFLLYQLYKLIKGSVAVNIFLGFFLIYLVYLVVKASGMDLLGSILGQFIGVGVIAAIVLFQQEIRKFLLILGRTTNLQNTQLIKLFGLNRANSSAEDNQSDINAVIKAAKELSTTQTGALMVFAKSDELKFYIDSGDVLDAVISKRLLLSIFNKTSPLHDGAVIIANNRIKAARCIIPVTEREDLPAQFGLRHRAAVGLTEVTDSLVIIVSEETGQMSLAYNGDIMHNLTSAELRTQLNIRLFPYRKAV